MKQHWVPRSYLSAWADQDTAQRQNPLVWALNIGERRLFHPSVTNIFAETHMYSVVDQDGTTDISLENQLAGIEGDFAEARNRFELGIKPAADDESLFAAYAAVMHTRSRSMRDHQRGQWQNMLDRMNEMEKRYQDHGARGFSPVAQSSDPSKVITREDVEHMVTNTAAMIVPIFAQAESRIYSRMSRATLIAKGNETFITSDQPCVWLDNEYQEPSFWQKSPLISKGLEVYLPISPRQCFVWSHTAELVGKIPVDDPIVRMMNLWIAAHATILIKERPLFEKTYCDNPRIARAVAGIYRRAF